MSYVTPVAPAKTSLGRYRVLAPNAGMRVSPIQLGAMSIGNKWTFMGAMDKESSLKLLDAYYDNGGNFIDTASGYQNGSSEEIIGEWMETKGIRDQIVLATKFSMNFNNDNSDVKQQISFIGNGTKSLVTSVEASLRKLRTHYIDILYLHWWDWTTSVEEIMNSLHNLVVQGKVLYLGISDAPAYIVSKANQYARDHGRTPFVIYQGLWNVMDRSFERDIIPMARDEGMALAPWNVLAGGHLRSDAEEARRKESGEKGRPSLTAGWERSEDEKKMSAALEKVGNEVGATSVTSVAIAYVMQKTPNVFPIIGGRKVEHLLANVEALSITLSPEHIKYLESILPFDVGFPYRIIGSDAKSLFWNSSAGAMDFLPPRQALRPADYQ